MDSQVIDIAEAAVKHGKLETAKTVRKPTGDVLTAWLNTNQCVDCVEGMKMLPSNCIDMVVTSPPYDGIRDYKGFAIDMSAVGKELFRVLKNGGIAAMVN